MTFVEDVKYSQVMAAQSSGTGTTYSDIIDMSLFESVLFSCVLGSTSAGAVISMTVQRGQASDMSDAADVGTTISTTATAGDSGGVTSDEARGNAMATAGIRIMQFPDNDVDLRDRATLMGVYQPFVGTPAGAAGAGDLLIAEAHMPPGRYRYLRAKVVRSAANSSIASVTAMQHNTNLRPVTQSSTVETATVRLGV